MTPDDAVDSVPRIALDRLVESSAARDQLEQLARDEEDGRSLRHHYWKEHVLFKALYRAYGSWVKVREAVHEAERETEGFN